MTFTALLNIFAWRPSEQWYNKKGLRDDLTWAQHKIKTGDNTDTESDDSAESPTHRQTHTTSLPANGQQTWTQDPWQRLRAQSDPALASTGDSANDESSSE